VVSFADGFIIFEQCCPCGAWIQKKMNCLDQSFQELKVRALQADRRTDETENVTTTQFAGDENK